MKRILLMLSFILFITACSNNKIETILLNNNYKMKKYDSGFTTFSKGNFLFSIFDESGTLITYEDNDEITISVNAENKNIYSMYNCEYDYSKNKHDETCTKKDLTEMKQAKKEIEKELRELNITFEDLKK